MRSIDKKMIETGIRVGDSKVFEEDKIWSRYSHDKVDIGEQLAKVIRTLSKAFPLTLPLRALSVGSSDEPQFRILETAFRGGLYLLDIEKEALDIVKERIHRQHTDHVKTILGDFDKIFLNSKNTASFLKAQLNSQKVNLITLHHSMYYCQQSKWHVLFENMYRHILASKAAIHAVLMVAESDDDSTTTWLYNNFVGKNFGCYNDQNLRRFKKELEKNPLFSNTQILLKSTHVHFFVDDFKKFMAVVWMILLYPEVHRYTLKQREEITGFIYKKFWLKKRPLVQAQDHLVIYRGIGFKGLI